MPELREWTGTSSANEKKRQKFHTKIQGIAINMNYVTQNVFIYSTRHVEIK